jgi:hypothetical protein
VGPTDPQAFFELELGWWVPRARAALERLGGPPRIRSSLGRPEDPEGGVERTALCEELL